MKIKHKTLESAYLEAIEAAKLDYYNEYNYGINVYYHKNNRKHWYEISGLQQKNCFDIDNKNDYVMGFVNCYQFDENNDEDLCYYDSLINDASDVCNRWFEDYKYLIS